MIADRAGQPTAVAWMGAVLALAALSALSELAWAGAETAMDRLACAGWVWVISVAVFVGLARALLARGVRVGSCWAVAGGVSVLLVAVLPWSLSSPWSAVPVMLGLAWLYAMRYREPPTVLRGPRLNARSLEPPTHERGGRG